jgi:GTP-binding protein EngB required for normal cell division
MKKQNPQKERLQKSLNEYINQKKSQEECVGFIDGYEQAIEDAEAQINNSRALAIRIFVRFIVVAATITLAYIGLKLIEKIL